MRLTCAARSRVRCNKEREAKIILNFFPDAQVASLNAGGLIFCLFIKKIGFAITVF